jgi:hypothetical protein
MKAMNPFFTPRHAIVAVALATLVTITGCSNQTVGKPSPTAPSAASTNSNSAPANVFGGLGACDVLNKALKGRGFTPAVVNTAGGDNGCGAEKDHDASAGLTLQPDMGIQNLNADPSKIHDGTLNGRLIAQIKNGVRSKGDCAIAIEVTKTSRAMVVITLSTGTTEEACALVYSIAEKVEPQLHKGN